MSLKENIVQFAKDEGQAVALEKLENWRDNLEEMQEACFSGGKHPDESNAVNLLLAVVRTSIQEVLRDQK